MNAPDTATTSRLLLAMMRNATPQPTHDEGTSRIDWYRKSSRPLPDEREYFDVAHAAVHRAPIAHGRILSVDTSEACAVPGVLAVLTQRDLDAERVGPLHARVSVTSLDGSAMIEPERAVGPPQTVRVYVRDGYNTYVLGLLPTLEGGPQPLTSDPAELDPTGTTP